MPKMNFGAIRPFVRFAGTARYTTERQPSVAYDTRMLLITGGAGTFFLGEEALTLTPGMLILFQPPTVYAYRPEPSFDAIVVDFDFTQEYAEETNFYFPCPLSGFHLEDAHPQVTFEPPCDLPFPVVLQDGYTLRKELEQICTEKKYALPFSAEKCSFLLSAVLTEIVRIKKNEGKRSRTLVMLLNYIADHMDEPISNKQIGQALHYDPCYLNRMMLSYAGKSLHQYILDYRIQTAIHRLETSDDTIENIAVDCGFASGAHFSNLCFEKTGRRPSYFRKISRDHFDEGERRL